MEFSKRKYARNEVEKIVSEVSRGYEERLAEQKARIAELVRDNSACRAELDSYIGKDKQISDALKNAEAYSDELRRKSDMQYSLAVEKLAAFLVKWQTYFDHLKEKYPMYPIVQEAVTLKEKISEIVGKHDERTVVYLADKEIDGVENFKTTFDPKEKIADYIAATSDNGFNMDEVLNPGALRLEDLCKELGLLSEKDL
ncbi:MAG: hypothetical protein J5911_02165 [Clostridia bacterium]|nr:hypothetical protein [Clostridia bacterium]